MLLQNIFRKRELFSECEKIFIEMFICNLKSFLKCIMITYFYKSGFTSINFNGTTENEKNLKISHFQDIKHVVY